MLHKLVVWERYFLDCPLLEIVTTEVHSYLMEQNSSGNSIIDPFLLDVAIHHITALNLHLSILLD